MWLFLNFLNRCILVFGVSVVFRWILLFSFIWILLLLLENIKVFLCSWWIKLFFIMIFFFINGLDEFSSDCIFIIFIGFWNWMFVWVWLLLINLMCCVLFVVIIKVGVRIRVEVRVIIVCFMVFFFFINVFWRRLFVVLMWLLNVIGFELILRWWLIFGLFYEVWFM